MKRDPYQIETFSVGQLATNCPIVYDQKTKDVVVIDPGDDGNFIAEKIISLHLEPKAILVTHGHFDHILGIHELQEIFHMTCYMNRKDNFLIERMKESAEYFLGRTIVEQKPGISVITTKKLKFGSLLVDIIDCPGHTPGGVSFILKDAQAVFTGDTLFAHGFIGRTDFFYSKADEIARSVEKLFTLPDNYVLYPGHGESSTIGKEKDLYENNNHT
jgi:glyoxylase-like metal-dependent hydrolase (beta-lactamase superfamily II)